jgi:hypothetical protein
VDRVDAGIPAATEDRAPYAHAAAGASTTLLSATPLLPSPAFYLLPPPLPCRGRYAVQVVPRKVIQVLAQAGPTYGQ